MYLIKSFTLEYEYLLLVSALLTQVGLADTKLTTIK